MPSSKTALTVPFWIASRRSGWLGRDTDWTLPPHLRRSANVKPAAFMTTVTVNIVGLAVSASFVVTFVERRRGKRSFWIWASEVMPVDLWTAKPITS